MENTNNTNERGLLSPHASLRVVFLLFFLCFSLANAGAGQDHRLHPDQAERKTLLAHFKAIEKETGYAFIYPKEILPALSQEVALDVAGQDIRKILPALFADTPLTYEVNGKQVVVEKKKESPSTPRKETKGRTVSGTITDTQGVPVPGADLIETGTSNASIYDRAGKLPL
uniref:STN domain-containing protein n=1 Tax=Candidatus Cryptobacteroides bacterium TaxID=3085639 RepID=UPI004029FF29